MHVVHMRVRGHTPFERRQLGIVGGIIPGVLNPILGGPTTTHKQPDPIPPTTTQRPPDPIPTKATTPPSPAGNTANLANGGGRPTESPNSGTGNGRSGDGALGGGTGTSTTGSLPGSASDPTGSGISVGRKGGTSGNTSSGGTSGGGASGDSSGSGTELNSGTGGRSSGSPSEGSPYSTLSSGTPGNGNGNGDSTTPSPSDAKTLDDNKSHGGAIAAAVILSLLFGIAVVIFILRRRSKARRDDQANKWWFTRKRTSQTYEALHTGNSSRRSSFATTVDHSNVSFLAKKTITPPPNMAETGRSKGTAPALVLDIDAAQNRFSIGSASSHGSQFLIIHHRESLLYEATNSARTESFPFPKPPISDRASLYSKASGRSRPELKEDDVLLSATSPSSPSQPTQTHVPAEPFADDNPFADPPCDPSPIADQITRIVRRPFSPNRQDELRVDVGDCVRIVQSFDDGWALAKKIDTSDGGQGFIPLECFEIRQSSSDYNTP